MTVPQTSNAPYRQQRWIELRNVGGTTIPAFGVVEITDSYRPESGGYTPGDGRTVLKVRRATTDNPCATCVNGPCEIPPGEERRIGTLDDPMLARVKSSAYKAGMIVGVKQNSFLLEENQCGYMILGDYDAGTGTMRVKRWDSCDDNLMVKALQCIKPGDLDKQAQPMKWDEETNCWVVDYYKPIVHITDCNKWLLVLPDECFKVERGSGCGSSGGGFYRPSFPYGLTRRVKIESKIDCGDCGNVTILKGKIDAAYCDVGAKSTCVLRACNTTGRKLACDADEYATFHATPGECGGDAPECYGWLVANPRALRARALLTRAMCGAPALFSEIEYLDVCDWNPRSPPIYAKNPYQLYGCSGDWIELAWVEERCDWEVVQVLHHEVEPFMMDIHCYDGCNINAKMLKGKFAIQQCEYCGETEPEVRMISGEAVTVITGIAAGTGGDAIEVLTDAYCGGTCQLTFPTISLGTAPLTIFTKTLCAFCGTSSSVESGPELLVKGVSGSYKHITGTQRTVIVGVSCYGCDMIFDTIQICDFCGNGTSGEPVTLHGEKVEMVSEVLFECDPCPKVTVSTTEFCVFCGVEPETVWDSQECECTDCPTGS